MKITELTFLVKKVQWTIPGCLFFRIREKQSNLILVVVIVLEPGADLGGGCRGCAPPPPEMTCGFLIQLVFCKKKKNYAFYWCRSRAREECTPPPKKKNHGSAPVEPKGLSIIYLFLLAKWERTKVMGVWTNVATFITIPDSRKEFVHDQGICWE